MQLSQRQQKILEIIMDGAITEPSKFMDEFGVTRRTIYNDLKEIGEWTHNNGINFEYSKDKIFFSDEPSVKKTKELMEDIKPNLIPLNQYSRVILVLTLLFVNDEGMSLKRINKKVGMSRATFYRDLPFIKRWLEPFDLQVHIDKEIGVRLMGEENDIREAMTSLILQIFEHYDAVELLQQEKLFIYLGSEKRAILDEYVSVIPASAVKVIAGRLYSMNKDLNSNLIQHMYMHEDSFIIILSTITILRFNKGHSVRPKNISGDWSSWADTVIKYLTDGFNLPEDEIRYLAAHYQHTRRNYYTQKPEENAMDKAIISFLEDMSIRCNYMFINNDELFQNIKTHLYVSVKRYKNGIREINPLKGMILEKFPELFNECEKAVKVFYPFLGEINDDEIGYLVLYLAAEKYSENDKKRVYIVCTTGKGSSELLKTTLSKRFSQIEILGTINMKEAAELKAGEADFILSTTFFYHEEIPVIRITPLLLDEDVKKISNFLDNKVQPEILTASGNKMDYFFEYMVLLTDCVNIVQAMNEKLGRIDNEVFISLTIHLMMRMQRDDTDPLEGIDPKKLNGMEKVIFDIICPLYAKYNKYVLRYDINSIKTYYKQE